MTRTPRRAIVASLACIAALAPAFVTPACSEDAVTLPDSWNTLHLRQVTIDVFDRLAGEAGRVRPLQGVDGAPIAAGVGLPDLTGIYWDRPNGSDDPDGAHVDVVRVGPERCALALDGMYLGGTHVASHYDFAALELHVESAEGARGEGVLLALDVSGREGPPCSADDAWATALDDQATWSEVAASAARFFLGDLAFDPAARTSSLVAVQLFRADPDDARWLELFATAAARVRTVRPELAIASPEVPLDAHADGVLGALLEAIEDGAPVDVITLAASGDAAVTVREVAALEAELAARGLDVDLAITSVVHPALAVPYPPGSSLGYAHLGAAEMALRLRLQGTRVRWLVSGRVPWRPRADAPSDVALDDDELVPTPYVDRAGVPTPAFMLRLPMRQVVGDQRVAVRVAGGDDLAVMASLDGEGDLSIIVAHPADATGIGSITYTIVVPGFTVPQFGEVPLRLMELDQSNDGMASFFFSQVGVVKTAPESGDIVFTRVLPVPGVHFIEIDQPLP